MKISEFEEIMEKYRKDGEFITLVFLDGNITIPLEHYSTYSLPVHDIGFIVVGEQNEEIEINLDLVTKDNLKTQDEVHDIEIKLIEQLKKRYPED